MLLDMLLKLVRWAGRLNVPVEETAWREAVDMVSGASVFSRSMSEAVSCISRFLGGIDSPVLVLLGE